MTPLPALFVTHGAPTLVLDDAPARDFLRQLGTEVGRPAAILCVSAHWEQAEPAVTTTARPETIHDFYGFRPDLYALSYPAPGAPEMAARAANLVRAAGLTCGEDPARGLDHGAWTPLFLMYPEADIPVAQLSVQTAAGPGHHLTLGAALAPLREENVLIVASGSATHNLRQFHGQGVSAATLPQALAFDAWLVDTVTAGDIPLLLDYRSRAPEAVWNHPSEEHFLPLFVAAGAGGGPGRLLHQSYTYGILAMTAFAFGDAEAV
ncbi:MAG: dioxygenase [Alphaproteobacteria bacterium]|nr:dioxygenase [Alphaproteobacteria bacterium]